MKNEYSITRIVFLVLFIALVSLCCIQFGVIGKDTIRIVVKKVADSEINTYSSFEDYLSMFNQWIGFWLSILTLILMLAGIWQYLQIRRYDSEFKEIKQEIEKKQKQLDDKLRDIEEKYKKSMDRIKIETNLSIMLRALGSINDPLMLLDISERKQLLYHYLTECRTLINQYSNCIIEKADEPEVAMNFQYVLLNVRLCLCRMSSLYADPMTGLFISNFMSEAKNKDNEIREANHVTQEDLKWLAKKIGEARSKMM